MIGWPFCWQFYSPIYVSPLLASLIVLFNCQKVVQLSNLIFFKQLQHKPKSPPSSLKLIPTHSIQMITQVQQHSSSSIPSKHQQSSSQLQQQLNDALSCLTIMETYTEIEPSQINQSEQVIPKIEQPEDNCQFLQNSQFKTTPFQASLSFIQYKEEYQKDNKDNYNKQQPQQLSQESSSSSSEQEQIIKKTTKFSPPRETLSILKRKKPAYPRTYNQHYKYKQDDTVCSTHYTPYHNSSPFNRINKSTFVRSDSQNKRYNDRRFNKTRNDQEWNFSSHGNGYAGHQRPENRYEAKREESYRQPQRNQTYYNQQQRLQPQPQHIEGNSYLANGENTYWSGFYPMQQMDWAQWNWYNRMKYYEYINTAHSAFPHQFQSIYPPSAVNFAIPAHIPPQPKTTEVHHPKTVKPTRDTLSPEKKGKICDLKFQMTINQCQLSITCSKSTTADILLIPYSINQPSLYPYLKHQDYWLTRDKMDKILTQSKTRNGDITFLATDRSQVQTIAFLRVPSPKDESFQTSFNRGLINLLTTCQPSRKSLLIPYSFQFGSSKQKLTKMITLLQQDPKPSFTSLTINCQDMKSFRRMSDGANRCLSSLSEQHLIFY